MKILEVCYEAGHRGMVTAFAIVFAATTIFQTLLGTASYHWSPKKRI
jgi:hypothetical protein